MHFTHCINIKSSQWSHAHLLHWHTINIYYFLYCSAQVNCLFAFRISLCLLFATLYSLLARFSLNYFVINKCFLYTPHIANVDKYKYMFVRCSLSVSELNRTNSTCQAIHQLCNKQIILIYMFLYRCWYCSRLAPRCLKVEEKKRSRKE